MRAVSLMCRWLSSFNVFIWQEGWKEEGEEDEREKGNGRMDRGRERETMSLPWKKTRNNPQTYMCPIFSSWKGPPGTYLLQNKYDMNLRH